MTIVTADQVSLPALGKLQQTLSTHLGPQFGVACSDVHGDPSELLPIERHAIRNAIPRRQREFAAGRTAARRALSQLGCEPSCIPTAVDRSPIWPDGVVGSIAHSARACVAVVGLRSQVGAVGVDVEEDRELDPDLWSAICTPTELRLLDRLPRSQRGRWAMHLFCAKEAFYKWQYPQTARLLAFDDVEVHFRPGKTSFQVHTLTQSYSDAKTSTPDGFVMPCAGFVLAWISGFRVAGQRPACALQTSS